MVCFLYHIVMRAMVIIARHVFDWVEQLIIWLTLYVLVQFINIYDFLSERYTKLNKKNIFTYYELFFDGNKWRQWGPT